MNKNIVEYIEEAPGLIRIKSSIEGLLTIDRYIQIARALLSNGLSEEENERLKDGSSVYFAENMLLKKEFNEQIKAKTVVFSLNGTDYILNSNNIEKIANKQKNRETRKQAENTEAIIESIQEMFTR